MTRKPICKWIGDGECCNDLALLEESYCERHYHRVYMAMPIEMAEHYIERELKNTSTDIV